jgi:hypothetical protein
MAWAEGYEMTDTRLMQCRVDSMLLFGIICSIVWMLGFGSLIAFFMRR